MDNQTKASLDVLSERKRQIEAEGWTLEHDDYHDAGELALAAAVYASPAKLYRKKMGVDTVVFTQAFPWEHGKHFLYGENRPTGRNYGSNAAPDPRTYNYEERRDLLVKAGALILAEIERIDRLAEKVSETTP